MSTAAATIVVRPDDLRTTSELVSASVDDMRSAVRRLDNLLHSVRLNNADPALDVGDFVIDSSVAANRTRSAAEHLEADAEFLTRCATDAEAADRCLPRTDGPIPTGLTVYSGLDALNTISKGEPVVDIAVLAGRWVGNIHGAAVLGGSRQQALPGAYEAWRTRYLTAGYQGKKIVQETRNLRYSIEKAPMTLARLNARYPAIARSRPVVRLGTSPLFRTTTKVGGPLLGGLSAGLDFREAWYRKEAGDVGGALTYGLRGLGGLGMAVGIWVPPLAVAGAVVVAGTLVYEYRDHIIDGAEYLLDKRDQMMNNTRNAVGHAAIAVADTVDDAITGIFRFGS